LTAAQSAILHHNFFERYAYVDAGFREPRDRDGPAEKGNTGNSTGDLVAKHEAAEIISPDAMSALQPMTSRADRPGIDPNPKEASIRQAEKTFDPSKDHRKFALLRNFFTSRKTASEKMSDEAYEKAANKAHAKRLSWALAATIWQQLTLAFCFRILSRKFRRRHAIQSGLIIRISGRQVV
jgi:single-stranded DNA-specific DHH superfamily exonuclease